LRKNFSWALFGSGFYAVCQFGLLVALTKIGDTRMAGQYTLGLAVTAPVVIFLGFNLRGVIVSDARRECPLGVYLAFRLLAMATAMCVIGAIVLIAGYRRETAIVIMLIALAKIIEAISDIFFGYFQQNERMDQITISMIVRGILSVLLFIDGMWIFGSVWGGVAGLITAWLTTLLLFDIPRAVRFARHRAAHQQTAMKSFWPEWDYRQIRRLFILSAPLGVVAMLISLNINIPRCLVESWHGEVALGIFGPITYFMVLGNVVTMALGQSAAPRMARYYVEGNRSAVVSLLLKQKLLGLLLGIVAIAIVAVAGPWILTVAFGPEYADSGRVFLLLTIACGISFVSYFSSLFLIAIRAFWIQIPLTFSLTLVTLIAGIMLIPTYGLMGAAAAMLISAAFHAASFIAVAIIMVRRMSNPHKRVASPVQTI
jgi:O-antigen/teichoic acid export membrane protein